MNTATYYHPEKLIPIDLLISSIHDELAPHLESKLKLSSLIDSKLFEAFISFLEYTKNTLLNNRSPKYHTVLWTFILNKVVLDFCYLISKHGCNLAEQKDSQIEKVKTLTLQLFKVYFADLNLGYVGSFRYNEKREIEEPISATSFDNNNLVLKICFPLFRNVLMLANNMFYNLGLFIHYSQILVDTIYKFQVADDTSYLFSPIICLVEKNIYLLSAKGVSISEQLEVQYASIKETINLDDLSFELYEKCSADEIAPNDEDSLEIEQNRIQRFYDDIVCFHYYRSLNSLYGCLPNSYINFTKLIKILAIDNELNIAQVKSRKYSLQKRSLTDAKSKISNEATYQTLPKIESTYFKSYSKRVELSKLSLLMNGLITDNLPRTTNVKDLRRHNLNPTSGDISKLLDATKDYHFIFDKDLVFNFIICAYYIFPNNWSFLEKNYTAIKVNSGFAKTQFNNVFSSLKPKLDNCKLVQDIFSEYLSCVQTILQYYKKSDIDEFQISVIESLKTRNILIFSEKLVEYGVHFKRNEKLYRFLINEFFEIFFVNFIEFKFNNGFEKIPLNWIARVIDNSNLQIEDILVLDDMSKNQQQSTDSIWTLMQANLAATTHNYDLLTEFINKIVQNRKQEWSFDGKVLNISGNNDVSLSTFIFSERIAECCYKIVNWNLEIEYICNS